MNDIMNLISTVGFPCAMCITILYLWRESEKQHDDKMDNLINALNDLKISIEKLLTKNEKE